MKEYVISEDVLTSIRMACYEAGKLGKQAYTVRGLSEEIVRCRECKNGAQDIPSAYFQCSLLFARVSPSFFCAKGERREANAD